MKRINWLAAMTALFVTAAAPAMAANYSAIYAFGDSLSDAGNLYLATSGNQPATPYVGGHFSNGTTWVEDLAASLNLPTLTPSLVGGHDFAFGGAVTGNSVTGVSLSVPTIAQQIQTFLVASPAASASALYAVWIGANDLLQAISNVATATTSASMAITQLTAAAQAEANAINMLAQAGGKNFLVPLVPDLGQTPRLNATALKGTASTLTADYNAALQSDLATLVSNDHINVSVLDTYSLIDAVVANPATYGLTDATDSCYTGPYTGGGSACTGQAGYLFWDSVHPTTTGHALIAAAALNEVPEPHSWAILAGALAALTVIRKRMARR